MAHPRRRVRRDQHHPGGTRPPRHHRPGRDAHHGQAVARHHHQRGMTMTGDDHAQADTADPLTAIRQHATAITTELAKIDQAHPGAYVITTRMRGNIETLTYDLSELR